MKTILLWLAGIGGLLVILGLVANILSVLVFGRKLRSPYVSYEDLSDAMDVWWKRQGQS